MRPGAGHATGTRVPCSRGEGAWKASVSHQWRGIQGWPASADSRCWHGASMTPKSSTRIASQTDLEGSVYRANISVRSGISVQANVTLQMR